MNVIITVSNLLYLGTGKNVRKAVSILKKKFPDLNLADVNNPAQSESYPEIPQVKCHEMTLCIVKTLVILIFRIITSLTIIMNIGLVPSIIT